MGASKIKDFISCVFSEVAETARVAERRGHTSDINPKFYEDPLRLLVNNMEGKITEFLNA